MPVSEMDDYSRLSSVQAGQPEFAIFRRFMPLQALQLNVLQAEIAHLRQGLGVQLEVEKKPPGNTDPWTPTRVSSFTLAQNSEHDSPDSRRNAALWDKLDALLERYSMAVPPSRH